MSKLSFSITRKNPKAFSNISKKYEIMVGQTLKRGANLVRNDAVDSILRGSPSGRSYEKYDPRRTHTASAPNQPPASDTGFLVNNIIWKMAGKFEAEVQSNAPYSIPLEFGTSKMAARPFLQPALEKNKIKIKQMVSDAIRRAT